MEEYIWQEGIAIRGKLEENPFERVYEIIIEEQIEEFRVENSEDFEIEFWYYDDNLIITHFRSYTSGYGSKVINRMEEVFRDKFDRLSIKIGTERGEDKTKEFLEKNDFEITGKEKTSQEWSDAILAEKEI